MSRDQVNSVSSHLACCDYSHAMATRSSLQEVYGELNVHTSFISEAQQIACFLLVTSNSKTSEGMMSLSSLIKQNIQLRSGA
jgi:hypothetical protein